VGWTLAEAAIAQTRYVLVVRVPRPVEVRIEDVYLSLAGTTKPVMGFHITLLGPCFLADPEGAKSQFISRVKDVCRRRKPLGVRLRKLGAFRGKDNNVVYLRITRPGAILTLHRDLLAATSGLIIPQDERYREWYTTSYQPHVTLGLGLSDRELEGLLHEGTPRQFDESFETSHIWLVEQSPQGPWQYVAEFPLEGSRMSDVPMA